MSRRPLLLRAGPPAATLLRRIGGTRPGSLALLVEVWGLDGAERRAEIEGRLAAGMAAMFERRDGSLTARLKVALIAGDRWLRQVAAQGEAAAPGDPPRPGLLGAGASLLFVAGDEALLAQAGPAVAYRLDPTAPAEAGEPALARHPAASPWLRRGLSALSDDALWPPLGMGQSGALEVHFSHWAFPPGAAVLLAPSRAAELLSRPRVREILLADEARRRRLLDELLPPELPLLCLAQARPPSLAGPAAPQAAEPEPGPPASRESYESYESYGSHGPGEDHGRPGPVGTDRTHRTDGTDGTPGTGGTAGPEAEAEAAAAPPDRWVRWIGPPAEAAEAGAPAGPGARPPSAAVPPEVPFDTGLLDAAALAWAAAEGATVPAAAPPASAPAPALAPPEPPAPTRPPPRPLALLARILLALLPRRDGAETVEEAGYARERARWGAAIALALPGAALTLTLLLRLEQIRSGELATDPGPVAVATEQRGVIRLTDIAPLADLPGEAADRRQLVLAGPALAYVLDRDLSQVDWVNPTTREQGRALTRGDTVGEGPPVGAIESIALVPPPPQGPDQAKPAELVALDAADRLWWLRPGFVEALPKPESPPWMTVDHLAGFQGRLYALDRSTGQIYRYEAVGGSFPRFATQGTPWFGQAPDLSQVEEMAIDGDVFLRLADGSLRRYRGGEAQPFALSGLPAGQPAPVVGALAVTAEGGPILAADLAGGGILVLGPDGAWRGTLLRPPNPLGGNPEGRFQGLGGLAWDGAAGRLYLLEGRSLYAAALPALP